MRSVKNKSPRVNPHNYVPTGAWCRLYASDLDDPRLQTLPPTIALTWLKLAALAALTNGILPDMRMISFRLRQAPHEIEAAIGTLISEGLLEEIIEAGEPPMVRIAGWEHRQFVQIGKSTHRVRKHRAAKKAEAEAEQAVEKAEAKPQPKQAPAKRNGYAEAKAVAAEPEREHVATERPSQQQRERRPERPDKHRSANAVHRLSDDGVTFHVTRKRSSPSPLSLGSESAASQGRYSDSKAGEYARHVLATCGVDDEPLSLTWGDSSSDVEVWA